MRIIVDNQIVKMFEDKGSKIMENPFLSNPNHQVSFRWPSFLQYLGLGSLLSQLPTFDQTHPLFKACVATLCANDENEVIFYVYDQIFAEILNQIKSLPQIHADFLLRAL